MQPLDRSYIEIVRFWLKNNSQKKLGFRIVKVSYRNWSDKTDLSGECIYRDASGVLNG